MLEGGNQAKDHPLAESPSDMHMLMTTVNSWVPCVTLTLWDLLPDPQPAVESRTFVSAGGRLAISSLSLYSESAVAGLEEKSVVESLSLCIGDGLSCCSRDARCFSICLVRK